MIWDDGPIDCSCLMASAWCHSRSRASSGSGPRVITRIHADGKTYLVYRTLNDLEMRLDDAEFLRIHRSAIVRLDQIAEVQPAGSSRYRVTLLDGTTSRRAESSSDLKGLIL